MEGGALREMAERAALPSPDLPALDAPIAGDPPSYDYRAEAPQLDEQFLLLAFTVDQPWVERGCGYRQWRPLPGEISKPAPSSAAPSGPADAEDGLGAASDETGFASAQQVTPQSFSMHGLLGEGNYSQVLMATLKSIQQPVALKCIDKTKVKRYKKTDEVFVEKWVLLQDLWQLSLQVGRGERFASKSLRFVATPRTSDLRTTLPRSKPTKNY